jgi:release factor glutamine methyltransferase
MQGLIDHSVAIHDLKHELTKTTKGVYKLYFGLGQTLTLTDTPDVFKVSLAGVRLGHYLVRSFSSRANKRSFLDMGTGSGVHALLIRKLGNNDITATDISKRSIEQAKINEHINFRQRKISFFASDLFTEIPDRRFQTIIFNPPGWRTPSESFVQQLETEDQPTQLPLRAMFYGDAVIMRFLEDLPNYLEPKGVAIVGLNSLVGIRDVLERYTHKHNNKPPLLYRLVERHTFPLIHYSAQWESLSDHLKGEFANWEKQDKAAYSTDTNGNIYWSYEIIEFTHCPMHQP